MGDRLSTLALFTWATACVTPLIHRDGSAADTAEDTGPQSYETGTDSADTGESLAGLDPALLVPPEGLWQAAAFTVPAARGLVWEPDPDFSLPGFTVPQAVVLGDGRYGLVATRNDGADGRFLFTSEDGESWDTPTDPWLTPGDFSPLDCGNRLEDAAVLYLADGSYLLVVEGTYTPDGADAPEWRRWCSATSSDGVAFTANTAAYFFEGFDDDAAQISVPSGLTLADGSLLFYYNGAAGAEGEGIRAAVATGATGPLVRLVEGSVLPLHDVDPAPVYVEGGGVRLYHTHGLGGGAGLAEMERAVTATGDVGLLENTPPDCLSPGGDCLLDPAFLRLADDRLVLYYTKVWMNEDGSFDEAIVRAWAAD